MSAELFQNDYARMFYTKARGYTPIVPDGDQADDSEAFLVEGVKIGDLIYRESTGPLVYAGINITKSADDPRNWQKLPKDYQPCSLELGIDYNNNCLHTRVLALVSTHCINIKQEASYRRMYKLADGGTRMMRLMSMRKGHDRIGGRNTFGRACHNVFRMPQGILISL
ncbi:hypothetical protein CPB85DRAFT_1438433 [Mucidula mucida]|nr:hypothetical protein CPB85DRAFT_1438433 [Mucidula mucida]